MLSSMSVIRRPGVLGRTTHQRVVGVTAALSAATVDAIAVGTWFALVVVHVRTLATAMGGLAILLAGALTRVRVSAATGDGRRAGRPNRLVVAIALATCWIAWLLVGEAVGGFGGVLASAACLAVLLTGQYCLERRLLSPGKPRRSVGIETFVPGSLVALGAGTLLASVWLVDLTVLTAPTSIAGRTVVLEFGAFAFGFAVFVCCSFLAHQRRFQRTLAC